MRTYSPIWDKLKAKGTATIVSPVSNHQTIINMVQKEKNLDIAFKLSCSERHVKYKLFSKSNPQKETLTFILKRSYLKSIGNL